MTLVTLTQTTEQRLSALTQRLYISQNPDYLSLASVLLDAMCMVVITEVVGSGYFIDYDDIDFDDGIKQWITVVDFADWFQDAALAVR